MVWKASAEIPPRRCKGIVKFVVGIVHLIYLEDSLEAALVETGVVRNQRESLDERPYLLPDIWEYRCIFSILRPKTVYPPAEPLVVLGLGVDEAVEGIYNLPITYYHHSYGAYAGRLLIRRFEVYCRKISHFFSYILFISAAESAIYTF